MAFFARRAITRAAIVSTPVMLARSREQFVPQRFMANGLRRWSNRLPFLQLASPLSPALDLFDMPSVWRKDNPFRPDFDVDLHVDVIEDKKNDQIELVFDLPGMSKDDVNVELVNGNLIVSGERTKEEKQEDSERNYVSIERQFGSFSRSLFVGKDVKESDISCTMKNGELHVKFPKSAEAKKELSERKQLAIQDESQ